VLPYKRTEKNLTTSGDKMTLKQVKSLKVGDVVRCLWNHPSGKTIDKVETVTTTWGVDVAMGVPSATLETLYITPYNHKHFTIVSQ
jgi:hypothetical protein